MISIFTTKDNLESICLDSDKQPWLEMIFKLKEVFVDDDNIFAEEADTDSDPFYILDEMQVDINSSKKDFINNIPNNPAIVLNQPSGIFLLNIPATKAFQIQKEYGVICQSTDSINHTPLTQPHVSTELLDEETGKSWKTIFGRFMNLPSNSALIIDAHLFDEDRFDYASNCYDTKHQDGLKNITDIIECLLPNTFNGTYHIGVLITDTDIAKASNRSRTNLTNEQIALALNDLKKVIKRNYSINIEVVFFDPNDDGHKLIHNRRIISNYFIVSALYKLAAFRNGKSKCDQSIETFPLFENIDTLPNPDKKEKRIRHDIKQLTAFMLRQPNSHTALLYQNGQKTEDFLQIQHRFFPLVQHD